MSAREKNIKESMVRNYFFSKYRKKIFWTLFIIGITIFVITLFTSLKIDFWKFFLSIFAISYLTARITAYFYVECALMSSENGVIHLKHLKYELENSSALLYADRRAMETSLKDNTLDTSHNKEERRIKKIDKKLERINSELALFKILD